MAGAPLPVRNAAAIIRRYSVIAFLIPSSGAADHHQIMPQPQDGAQQWPGIGSGGEPGRALALRLGADCVQSGQCGADAVLKAMKGVIVEPPGRARGKL